MPDASSDAFVFFGATGDLAYQQIFPALQALVGRGHLDGPIIGVARPEWNVDQLRARARESIAKHGGVDPEAFAKLSTRLCHVGGDYRSEATFDLLQQALGSAARPLGLRRHSAEPLWSLEIPPKLCA